MLTAHSGSDHYQDNSLEFIEAALKVEVDCFEIDCRQATDGTLYLNHDEATDFDAFLTLPEAYALMAKSSNHTTMINVDCKEEPVGRMALDLAEEYGVLNRVVLSGTLNLDDFTPEEMNHLFYNLENIIPWDPLKLDENFETVAQKLSQYGLRVVQTHFSAASEAMLEVLSRNHLKLSVWTVNEVEEIDRLFDLGCLNVTSRIAFQYLDNLESRVNDEA